MKFDNLLIFKSAMNFAKYIENIVKKFDRYSRYTIGTDLRNYSHELLFLISKANKQQDKKETLSLLVEKCDELFILIHLAKELENFQSFKQFEESSRLLMEVSRQANGWLNSYLKK